MDVASAQVELRASYLNGGPGAIVSGIVWLVAALASSRAGVPTGFVFLFFGGMTIFPISALLVRVVFRRDPPSVTNIGGRTVTETVFPMLAGFLAAWLLLPYRPELVFPLSAIAVGAHYFGFRTAYGDVVYWVIAAVLCGVGLGSIFMGMPSGATVPYVVAAIEVVFGVWITARELSPRRTPNARSAA
ncbi:MAG: hypothetical protein KF709_08180 [Gemmatimonadaceae bacterium]|nr:hypothetical protein [Gemmatimonadaceae bacterium]